MVHRKEKDLESFCLRGNISNKIAEHVLFKIAFPKSYFHSLLIMSLKNLAYLDIAIISNIGRLT